jgi:DNA-binding response OmpR family regulator
MPPTRVLVVEDEAIIRMIMVDALTDAGFEVDEASNSDEAERLLDEDGYKLLVTDIHMPGRLDGVQLAEQLHRYDSTIPILFVTARPDVLARVRAAGLKSTTLPKPFSPERLVSTVSLILRDDAGNHTA